MKEARQDPGAHPRGKHSLVGGCLDYVVRSSPFPTHPNILPSPLGPQRIRPPLGLKPEVEPAGRESTDRLKTRLDLREAGLGRTDRPERWWGNTTQPRTRIDITDSRDCTLRSVLAFKTFINFLSPRRCTRLRYPRGQRSKSRAL